MRGKRERNKMIRELRKATDSLHDSWDCLDNAEDKIRELKLDVTNLREEIERVVEFLEQC